MLARSRRAPVRAELVFLGGERPLREPVAMTEDEVAGALARALDVRLAELARRSALRARWEAAANTVRFPFATFQIGRAHV